MTNENSLWRHCVNREKVLKKSLSISVELIMSEGSENEDLICPITLELFHEPVRASDGRVYEREAITKWINEHGTSPYTRQPLQLDQLKPDQRLKQLADKIRKSSVSYHVQDEIITLPPLEYVRRYNSQVYPNTNDRIHFNWNIRQCSNKVVIPLMFTSFLIPLSLILGIVLGLKSSFSQGN